MSTIPASNIVNVNPGVIGTGGSPLALNGVILSQNLYLPTGAVEEFNSAQSVSDFFGPAAAETAAAEVYFLGFDNSTIKPGNLFFAPFNLAARAAWLHSGSFAGYTLAQLQAITAGTLTIVVNGTSYTSSSINLSAASSFTAAAADIQSAFTSPPFTVTWDPILSEFVITSNTTGTSSTITDATSVDGTGTACTTASSVLTVGGTVTGTFNIGDIVTGTDGTHTLPANTTILNQLTGTTGGAGTYTLSAPASGNLTSCTVTATGPTGAFAVAMQMTAATGATLSQGAALDTPASAMANVVANTQNWVDFTTMWQPVLSDKENFAIWTNEQNQRYMYVAWDTDVQATEQNNTANFGAVVNAADYNGIAPVYNTLNMAVLILSIVACIDFSATNGRLTVAFKTQSGFVPTVTNAQIAANLLANGYSFYGAYATANDDFNFVYNGQLSGVWNWIDTFVNQVYMNSQFQLALMTLLTQIPSIPYNPSGYALIRSAMTDPIQSALNFGAIRTGVVLSQEQTAVVNNAAGANVAPIIQQQGYYLQILDPGATARGLRQTPIINFWYTDGGAVQQITLASIDIQ